MRNSRCFTLFVLSFLLVSLAGCGIFHAQPHAITPNPTGIHVCCVPPPQQPQIDACAAAGGGVDELLKNYGTWQGFYAFKCVCKAGSSFFGNQWACNQWYPWPVNPPSWISNTPLTTLEGTLQSLVLSTPVQASTPIPTATSATLSSTTSLTSTQTLGSNCVGCSEPTYLIQMDACVADGGRVERQTKNMGTWTAVSAWECICKNGSSTFGDHLTCNQWSTPAP